MARPPCREPALCVVAFLSLGCLLICEGGALKPCRPMFGPDGHAVIESDCAWQQQQEAPTGAVVVKGLRSARVFPSVMVSPGMAHGRVIDGFQLTLRRLVLHNASFASATGAATGPRFLPLGLFKGIPRNLSLVDMRLFVDDQVFQQYLNFFSKQLRSANAVNGAGPSMHTDGASFLNVPYWSDNTTELISVTLVSSLCNSASSRNVPAPAVRTQWPVGCNIRIVDNTTLLPTLLADASIATDQFLLIRIVANVTLGPGLTQPIMICRPVLLLGMASAVTSVDLGMVVNQLNVTASGQVVWQSLALENLAPGDSVSSLVAAPFSTTVTSNVWALYCNRSRTGSPCVTLSNVTCVVPSQDELNYQSFMYTMFKSPAPALREMTDFYRTDLHTSTIQFVPGPGNDTLTIIRLVNTGWDFWYVVSTLRSIVAPKRPLPRQAFSMQKYRTGALVQSIQDCSGFVSALSSRSTSSRVRVWTLLNNVTIADKGQMLCPWPDGNLTFPMQLLGQVVRTHGAVLRGGPQARFAEDARLRSSGPSGASNASNATSTAAADDSDGPGDAGGGPLSPPLSDLYSLAFGYATNVFELPTDAQDKYLQIQNITLTQLPQASAAPRDHSGRHRRLQQRSPLPPGGGATPIGIWTIMLWPIKRSMTGVPITITDSQLLLPQPEWDALADEARQAPSFALQLTGLSGGLTFIGVTLLDNSTLRVGSFQGPGIAGSNLWLIPDPAAAAVPGYSWPYELFSAAPSSSISSSGGGTRSNAVALGVGIGLTVSVLALLALGLAVLVVRLRRRHAAHTAAAAAGGKAGVGPHPFEAGKHCSGCHSTSSRTHQQQQDQLVHAEDAGGHAWLDVVEVHDTVGQLPGDHRAALVAAATGAAGAAACRAPNSRRSSSSSRRDSAESAASPRSSYSVMAVSVADAGVDCDTAAGKAVDSSQEAGSKPNSSPPPSMEQTIADGLERWNAAVSMTTLQLMQRRLQGNNSLYSQVSSTAGSGSGPVGALPASQHEQQQQQRMQAVHAPGELPAAAGAARSGDSDQGLQLFNVIGTGSFGSVYLGSWRGKRVAVKVMHLHSSALEKAEALPGLGHEQQERLQRQRQQNSPPHMAIMEAVLSSAMSHPNVVQVYTYMLSPLMVQPGMDAGQGQHAVVKHHQQQQPQQQQQRQQGARGDEGDHSSGLWGYQLRLVMEYADRGTLRDALDKRQLPRLPGTTFPHPAVVYSLSHDVAAAMLHLHTEGIVHGDLKAGNVLLTVNSTPGSSGSCGGEQCSSAEVWAAAGSQPLTAKCADFGMALPLGPQDTHATMLARGTPTHMSPELFMAGHVSKASDMYAFGILLYEIITGCRAFAGVPIPLLPHEVAMQGLRPAWPRGVPAGSQGLRKLAEACWVHSPQDRPTFNEILRTLEEQQGAACSAQQQEQPAADPAPAAAPPVLRTAAGGVGRKADKDQMSWSEISYGGSRHDGGWA